MLVDHWTINDSGYCGLVGDGTVTVDLQTTKPARRGSFIDPYAGWDERKSHGSWVLGVAGRRRGRRHAFAARRGDDHARRQHDRDAAADRGDCGGGHDKSGCGTARWWGR